MHDELGFERYGAHGSDLGAGSAARLARAHPESVVGIHLSDLVRIALTPDVQRVQRRLARLAPVPRNASRDVSQG